MTTYQARFRAWLDTYKEKNEGNLSPQKIQKYFKSTEEEFCYEKLSSDLLKVNSKLIEYKNVLEKIVFNKEFNK